MPSADNTDFLMGEDTDSPAVRKGAWFPAAYPGQCSGALCGIPFYEGDMIRADGEGGWEARECFDDAPEDHS